MYNESCTKVGGLDLCKGGFDAGEGFGDAFVAEGVGHAEVFRCAEGVSGDAGDVCFFEEVHGEVGGVVDGVAFYGFAEEG